MRSPNQQSQLKQQQSPQQGREQQTKQHQQAKRLPGFLRRSLRPNSYNISQDDEDDDTYDDTVQNDHEEIVNHLPSHDSIGTNENSILDNNNNDNNDNNTNEKGKLDEEEEEEEDATIQVNSKFRLSLSLSEASKNLNPKPKEDIHTMTNPSKETQPKAKIEKKLSYKEASFQKVIEQPVVDLKELRRLSWNGIPNEYRTMTWQMLLGYLPVNASRREQSLKRKRMDYINVAMVQHYNIDDNDRTISEQETLRQVLVDVPRTAPDIPLFRNERIRTSLGRLLYIWAMRHPASSYVQGINDLATPLFLVFLSNSTSGDKKLGCHPIEDVLSGSTMDDISDETLFHEIEADVYGCLTNLLAGIQDHYTQDQPGVQRMVLKLEELICRVDKPLSSSFEEKGVSMFQFAFKWMNCLLLREFTLQRIVRLWDTYLSEENGFEYFHVYVCAAFLCQFSQSIQEMEFDQLFSFMQNIPTSDWGDGEIEILLSQAYVLSTLFHGSDAHLISQRS